MLKRIVGLLAVLCFMGAACVAQDTPNVNRSKIPCKNIYKEYAAKRTLDIKILGAQISASSEPVSIAKANENNAQERRDMYTLCEQFKNSDMTLKDYYERRAEIQRKYINKWIVEVSDSLTTTDKATPVVNPKTDKNATAPVK